MLINTSLSTMRPIYHDALDTIAVIGIMAMMWWRGLDSGQHDQGSASTPLHESGAVS